jgi:hypothetical protein
MYAIDGRGVQLFAASYAKRAPLDGDVEPAPAAAVTLNAENRAGKPDPTTALLKEARC